MSLSDSQLEAVCHLLNDGSPRVTEVLDRQVSEFSTEEQQRLLSILKKREVSDVILPPSLREFHYRQIEIAFSDWSLSSVEDVALEDACFLLASFGHPLKNMKAKKDELLSMENHLRKRLEGISKDDAIVDEVVEYLHGELRFDGARENYYDAQNSFMSRVLERRRAFPYHFPRCI